jgi:ABC-2 type transport system ATP-binding protein
MDAAISVQGLRKSYGDFEAVRGIDFDVAQGRSVRFARTERRRARPPPSKSWKACVPRTAGNVTVLGTIPRREVRSLKDRIGVCLQATNLPDKILVKEALELFSAFYSRNTDNNQLLKRLQLWEKRDSPYSKLSGGQKQRVRDCPRAR